jgi:DNA uptake protein ComE-like DNA-binding protein
MKRHVIYVVLCSVVLALSINQSGALENKVEVQQESTGKAKATPAVGIGSVRAKHKATARVKPVNINGASREELKKLPGIDDAAADKIIAGRPYPTKAHLVTRNIIAIGVYETIKHRIVAKQPYKDMNKNAALYRKNK